MPAVSFEMMNHFTLMDQALKDHQLEGSLNFFDYTVELKREEHYFRLFPQFQNKDGYYYTNVSDQTSRFMGWRPYHAKVWPTATNKIDFKRFLVKHSISTPRFYTEENDSLTDVIVKPQESSFSKGIRGPFKSSEGVALNKKSKDFFEQYIEGKIAKIWFWNHSPVAAEVLPPLKIFGNGHSNIGQLITAHAKSINRTVDTSYFKEFLAYYNKSLETVLADGEQCDIDFRYKSLLPTSHQTKDVYVLDDPTLTHNMELERLGRTIEKAVPFDLKKNFAYVIDVVIDKKSRIWVLELNCNPHIHPFIYHSMVNSLLCDGQPSADTISEHMCPIETAFQGPTV